MVCALVHSDPHPITDSCETKTSEGYQEGQDSEGPPARAEETEPDLEMPKGTARTCSFRCAYNSLADIVTWFGGGPIDRKSGDMHSVFMDCIGNT